jgi:effector-binding domain-containing protein
MAYEIELRRIPRQDVAMVRYTSVPSEIGAGLGAAYGEIGAYLHERGLEHPDTVVYMRVRPAGPDREVEAGFTVTAPIEGAGRVRPGSLPECEAAVVTHVGSYAGLPAGYAAIQAWLTANNRASADYPWEAYLTDPQTTPMEQNLTEIVWPIRPL